MSNNKLLRLAARAYVNPELYESEAYMDGFLSNWNPLDDDGDAIRLAVKLGVCISIYGMFVTADMRNREVDLGYVEENTARNDGCIMKATRLAIVRAAAIIGEGM